MAVASGSIFACEACGKIFNWKATLAGKKAKCACGTIMTVPEAPLVAAKPKKPKSLKPATPSAQVPESPKYGYIPDRPKLRPVEELPIDKLVDKVRDLYVPTALVVISLILIGLWALVARGIVPQMSMLEMVAACVSTFIKTIILVAVCVAITSRNGEVSLGMFWTAVLKFSSIILLNDAMLTWFEAWQIHRGAIEIRHGVMYIDVWLLVWEMFMATFLIAILLWYLFDIEKEQMFWIASPIAFGSVAVGLGLRFAIGWGVGAYQAATAPTPAATAPPPAPPAVVAPAPAVPVKETPRDKVIRMRIEENSPLVKEGAEYMQGPARARSKAAL